MLAELLTSARATIYANRMLKLWMSAFPTIVCCAGYYSCSVYRLFTLRQLEGPGDCSTLTRSTITCRRLRCAMSSRTLSSRTLSSHTLTSTATLLHYTTITELLDRQVSVRHVTCRRRPSCVWFDDKCCTAKRAVQSLERLIHRAKPHLAADPSTVAAWRIQRRQYVELVRQKRSAFWTSRIHAEQSQPRRLCLRVEPKISFDR